MNLKNLNIGTQLKIGLTLMLFLVIVLGLVSYWQSKQIHLQTDIMYEHPLQVRRALGALEADILNARIGERDFIITKTEQDRLEADQLLELSISNAIQQFNLLYDNYLGPRKDIDEAYQAFIAWNTAREENAKLILSGEIEKAKKNLLPNGSERIYRDQMMSKIMVIDKFALNKGDELHQNSTKLFNSLNIQLVLLLAIILILTLIVNYIILRNIRNPLNSLTEATKRFHDGDMSARCSYTSQNEIGVLSDSFNSLAESIQVKLDLDEKAANLAGLMLSEYEVKKFFQYTINALAAHTGSQMAAIYILSEDKKTYNIFESTGLDQNARQSFAADCFEGEFGPALASQQIQHIKDIAPDTRFVFHSVSGKFIPHEIITIPILADNDVIAIISLATIGNYTKQTNQLIDNIHNTLCARVEGIMAYHKMKEFSEKLELQNMELDVQKTELAAQSAALIEQNTELEMQKSQLDEASRLKTNFLSNMSHELRTPLNSVIALTGVLNRRLAKKISEEEQSYLEVIERNGKNLLLLINDILDISRIEAGREEIEISEFKPNNLIADVVNMIQPQAKQKKIELIYSESDKDLLIKSDIGKCHHILQNLISNAVKFTEKGKVELTISHDDKKVEITVTDTGIGIAKDQLLNIFDEFRQADGSTSRKYGGTGLGLAIAKKYALLIGGSISVKSEIDKGSAFTLTLPLIFDTDKRFTKVVSSTGFIQTNKPEAQQTVSVSSVKTILLVDDSEPAIIQMKDFLEESGYRMLVAHNGSEALAIIAQTIPDAMILDLMMPDIDGFEVLKTIRDVEETAHIPVLILTAKHITKEELKFLKQNHIHQLIQKGDISRIELLKAISAMVLPESSTEYQTRGHALLSNTVDKPLVLVVEDNPDNMTTVKALLADKYTVLEAIDGSLAVEMAKKHPLNLILMDIAIPGMDGIEAFKAIRKSPKSQHIPIIALTASAMVSDRETILSYGFDAYIPKPIDQVLFFKIINETLYGK